MNTLENVLTQWEETGRFGSREARMERGWLWLPFYAFLARKAKGSPYRPGKQPQTVAAFLLREGVLQPTDSILDLGAGMGSYSLELAKHCKKVTALDTCGEALDVLADWSRQANISNIALCHEPWETFVPDEPFDITFSAMCPAICNREEILRLEGMTKRTACLLTVSRGSYEKCRRELMSGLSLKKPEGMVTEALQYFDVLSLMGRQPNVKCWSESFATCASTEALIEQYRIYIRIFGVEDDVSVPYMRDFFARREVDGCVTDECRMNYALIYWDVPSAAERA